VAERWCPICERLTHHDGSCCTSCHGNRVSVIRERWDRIQAERAARRAALAAGAPQPPEGKEP